MGKKRKRRRSSQYGWFRENAKYLALGLLATVTVFLVTLAVTRPAVAPAAEAVTEPAVVESEAARPLARNVAFLGDSYTEGAGSSSDRQNRWTTIVSRSLGWSETNFGVGGSGYVQGDVYANRVPQIIEKGATIVIVSGGRNDVRMPLEKVEANTTATFQQIRAGLPEATIIAVSPWWDDDAEPEGLADVAAAIKAAVESVGGVYIEAGQPLSGNAALLSGDGVHPNDEGYAALAAAVREQLASATIK